MIETLIRPPDILPLSLQEVKDTLRINVEAEDERLTSLIQAATSWVEGLTGKALVTQTRSVKLKVTYQDLKRELGRLRSMKIPLPTLPLIQIEDVLFEDKPVVLYRIHDDRFVILPDIRYPGEVSILYQAGYGPDRESVPASLRQTILMAVVRFYEEMTFPHEKEVSSLLAPHKSISIH